MKYYWSNTLNCVYTGDMQPGDRLATAEEIAAATPQKRTVRTFAKDDIWAATKDMVIDEQTGQTAWEAFKTFLLDSELWEGWCMQAYLLEENHFFAEFYPRAVAVFGAELVDSVLAASVVETKNIIVTE